MNPSRPVALRQRLLSVDARVCTCFSVAPSLRSFTGHSSPLCLWSFALLSSTIAPNDERQRNYGKTLLAKFSNMSSGMNSDANDEDDDEEEEEEEEEEEVLFLTS